MKRYDSYKPSGIEWIGEIPSHWKVIPVKYFYYLKGRIGWQGLRADEFTTEGPHLVTGTDFVNGRVDWNKCYRISEDRFNEAPEIHVKSSDILITKDGTVGKLAYIEDKPEKVSLNSHLLIMRPLKSYIINRYVFWYFHSKPFKIYSELIQDGSIMASLSQEDISNFKIILPSVTEQESIADYLDKKCGEIDRSIAKQQRRIELLEELKQSVIIESFDIDAPKLKLRFVFEFRNGYTPSKANPEFWKDGTIPWFRMEDIRTKGRILDDAIQHITPEAVKTAGLFDAGSFIMATTATIGEHALLIADSLANQRFTNLKIRKSLSSALDTMYVFYFLYVIDDWCKSTVNTTCFSQVDMDEFRNQKMPIPPIEEQKEIVLRLDKRCVEIDSMIEREKKKIELMQELKQSIITEVVTGKRKVV